MDYKLKLIIYTTLLHICILVNNFLFNHPFLKKN